MESLEIKILLQKIANKKIKPLFYFLKKSKTNILILILILILTAILYWPTINYQFIFWDDAFQIYNNPDITLINWTNLKKIFSSYYIGMYQPLTTLTYAIIYHFWQLKPEAYHLLNIFLHLLNIILVYLFVKKLFNKKSIGLIVAALFAFSPILVEAVSWLSATSTLLSTSLLLVSLINYTNWLDYKKRIFLILAFIFFVLACLAKAHAIIVPLLFLTIKYWRGQRITFKNFINHSPLLIISAILAWIMYQGRVYFNHIFSMEYMIKKFGYNIFDLITSSLYALHNYWFRLIFPFETNPYFFYPKKIQGLLPLEVYLGIFLTIIFGYLLWKKRHNKLIIFSFAFYTISLILLIRLTPLSLQLLADRYAYLACLPVFWLIAKIIVDSKYKKIAILLLILTLITHWIIARHNLPTWENEGSVWNKAINSARLTPITSFSLVYNNLGYYLMNQQKWLDAYWYYLEGEKIDPDNFNILYSLVLIEKNLINKKEQALKRLEKLLLNNPNCLNCLLIKANILWEQKNYQSALIELNSALKLEENGEIFYQRSMVNFALNNIADAQDDLLKALMLRQELKSNLNLSAEYFIDQKNQKAACFIIAKAIELKEVNNNHQDYFKNCPK